MSEIVIVASAVVLVMCIIAIAMCVALFIKMYKRL